MEERILKMLTIIQYDDCLYYYDGYCYQIIRNQKELVKLIRSKVSRNAFASSTLRCFPDLYTYIQTNEALISSDCMRKIHTMYLFKTVSLISGIWSYIRTHLSTWFLFTRCKLDTPSNHQVFPAIFTKRKWWGFSNIPSGANLVPYWCPILQF